MKKNTSRQYTIRNIPEPIDRVLRRRAKATGKSFNQVAVEALAAGTGASSTPKRDLSFIIGSIDENEAAQMETEIRKQRQIDKRLWK